MGVHNKVHFKKIAFGDNLRVQFLSGFRKVFCTFLHHKLFLTVFIFSLCLLLPKTDAAQDLPFFDSNKTISIDLRDGSLKDVLKIFSMQSGLNFIASEAVQDRIITLYLDKVPIKEVMDKLFKANNLSYELNKDENIFIVKDWGKPEIETITKVYYIKYRSVPSARLETEKTNLLQAGVATAAATTADIVTSIKQVLSSAGKINEDIRTNSLIITDIPGSFPDIEQVIAKLDIPVSQVLIEVEMLDVSKDTVDKLGFEFDDSPFSLILPGGFMRRGANSYFGLAATRGAEGAVTLGRTYAQTLDFLRTQTDTKYLARPRLLTLNNETAEISITKDEVLEATPDIGQRTNSVSGVTEDYIEGYTLKRASESLFLDKLGVGIILRVTPQINLETNEVSMVINPKTSSSSSSALVDALPAITIGDTEIPTSAMDIEKKETKSIVKVKDGETVILGGIIHRDRQVTTKKLPILGDIPFLGALFRHKNVTTDLERELLIFITPHIVRDTIEFAQTKKVTPPEREQNTISAIDRRAIIASSLNNFEKKK